MSWVLLARFCIVEFIWNSLWGFILYFITVSFLFSDVQGSLSSCNATTAPNTNQVSHPETVQFELSADENGTFGFTLQGANSSNNDGSTPSSFPTIGYVEPNSSAERCGLMQPGDRIISVNNQSLEGLSLEEARKMIKDSGSNLRLETEFDVAGKLPINNNNLET